MRDSDKNIEKMAELGRMTRGLVHDFNNSLSSILGYAEFLASDLDPQSEQYQFAQNIRKAGLQLQNLIDQIRAYGSEKNAGKDEKLDLVKISTELCERLQSNLGTGQELHVESTISSAILQLPAHQYKTFLGNLVKNAVEALEHRTGTVTVRLSDGTNTADMVENRIYDFAAHWLAVEKIGAPLLKIEIQDTGCGMDESVLELAPSPHFTTKTSDGAHGMGLPVALGIINYLDGGCTILTTPDQGTCITVLIPVDQLDTKTNQSSATSPIPPRSILLIEDRDMVRHTIETMLARLGHRVESFSNGLEALDRLKENPRSFDLVMTDFTMPDLNGKEMVEEIHADFPNMPIIVISGDSHHLDKVSEAIPVPHVTTLEKPVTQEKLASLISKF